MKHNAPAHINCDSVLLVLCMQWHRATYAARQESVYHQNLARRCLVARQNQGNRTAESPMHRCAGEQDKWPSSGT
eukprot:CAMPEP_0174305508 /NCGR_PEP_ID=MMETSP0809-20121228/61454_1 /TAXON_ID=73025 ORGANISM="Eutreptiella gymnastica-like, Strain CCMP1594" /NCGR_SAMPLE_ID=MMETSP0809 /ASSEMBLY_ACC=CAM_ASM_000658 /LENGTH=74 /DNA_ID=CAMNT_0015411997 /DNA_START=190 /DNA_END=414 /DNA_ORIENTATION=+